MNNRTEQNENIGNRLTEAEKRTRMVRASAAERVMLRRIGILSVCVMVLLPLAVCFGLRFLSVYVDTDLSVLYPSSAMTVLQWVLYYLVMIGMALTPYAGFGILGYSVLRYGVKQSLLPVLLTVAGGIITYVSGICETLYLYGWSTIQKNFSYAVSLWIVNFFLAVFSYLCVIFLCAMLRISFVRRGRMAVGISREDRAARQKNVLRRLYLWIALMTAAFSLLPEIMNSAAEIGQVGAPGDFWDFFTFFMPYIELLLFSALGWLLELKIGESLTSACEAVRLKIREQEQVQD